MVRWVSSRLQPESRYRRTSTTDLYPKRVKLVHTPLPCERAWARAASSERTGGSGGPQLRVEDFRVPVVLVVPPGFESVETTPPATMRGAVFLVIIALCALTEESSAVARAGGAGTRAGKSRGSGRTSNGSSSTGGDRDRPARKTTTAAARRNRDKAAFSHDGAQINGKGPSSVVIGTVREERGHQVRGRYYCLLERFMSFLVRRQTNGQKSCARTQS